MVDWSRACNGQFRGSGQRSRSQEAEVRCIGLAEASFSLPFGQVFSSFFVNESQYLLMDLTFRRFRFCFSFAQGPSFISISFVIRFCSGRLNSVMGTGTHSPKSNNMKLVHWPLMGWLLHLVQRGGDWAGCSPPSPLLAVPNVTAHPSSASVPITVLRYNGPLLCGLNVPIKGSCEHMSKIYQAAVCTRSLWVLFARTCLRILMVEESLLFDNTAFLLVKVTNHATTNALLEHAPHFVLDCLLAATLGYSPAA